MTSINLVRSKTSSSRRSVPRLYVQAVFALAAALALSTSACGKKEDGAQPVAGSTVTAPSSTNTATVGTVAGTGKSELDTSSGVSSSEKEVRGEGPSTQTLGTEGEPDPLAAKPAAPARELELESVVYYDPNGLTPDQIFAKKSAVDQAGAFLGEAVRSDINAGNGSPLFYTGAGEDTLREHLYTLVNQRAAMLDEATRAGDKRLAQTIQLSDFNVDWSRRTAELNFSLERIGSQGRMVKSHVKIEGGIDNLNRFEVGSLNRKPFIKALVACMDISGGCKTVHIRVQDASSGQIETAHLIARHTNATLFIRGNAPGVAKNAEYDRLMGILLNTVNAPAGQNVVEQLTLTTSETIGGASNFAARMKMRLQDIYGRTGGDTFEVTGPLAKPMGSDEVNVAVNVTPALTVINGQLVPTTAIGTEGRIVDVVRDARLIRNDGRGNLEIELTIRSAAIGATVDRILLTVARIHTPTSSVRIPMQ